MNKRFKWEQISSCMLSWSKNILFFGLFWFISGTLIAQSTSSQNLINAIRLNDTKTCVSLLDKGADPNSESTEMQSAMDMAISNGNTAVIQALINHGATQKSGMDIAVEKGDEKLVTFLIENGFYVGEAIIKAAEMNDISMVRLLIHSGAEVDITQKRKTGLFRKEFVSPIQFSVKNNNQEMTMLLIDHGVPIQKAIETVFKYDRDELLRPLIDRSSELEPLLFLSTEFNKKASIEYILSKTNNPNISDSKGNTLLHIASENGNVELLQYFTEQLNLGLEGKNLKGETPLMLAVHSNNIEAVRFLLDKQVNVNSLNYNDENALFYVIENNRSIFQLLINKGTNVSQEAKDNTTLLIKAVKSKNYEIIRYLLDNGAKIEAKDDLGFTAFQYLIEPYNRNEPLIDLFLEKGADINAGDPSGKSMMFYAIEREHIQKVKQLHHKGASIDVYDNRGYRPRVDDREIIVFIVENGANINALDNRHDSYLCAAVYKNDLELAHFLVDKGIDLNINCYFEEPPLIKAIEDDNITLVKFLVDNGADVNAEGYFKKNVMDYAEKRKNSEIISYLESHGSMNKTDRNDLFKRTMEMERQLRNDIRTKNEEKLVQDMKKCSDLVIQHRIIHEIAHFAVEVGNPVIVELLLTYFDFDINSSLNDSQQTLLILAVLNDKTTLTSYLLGKNADKEKTDIYKKKAHDYAKSKAMRKLF